MSDGAGTGAGPGPGAPPLSRYISRLVWLCMLPLLLLSVALAVEHLRRAWAANEREAERVVQSLASRVDDMVQDRIDVLSALAHSPLLDGPERLQELHQATQSLRETFGGDVVLRSLDGRMLMHSGLPVGAPLPQQPAFAASGAMGRALAAGQPVVSDAVLAPVTGRWIVAVIVPVQRGDRVEQLLATSIDVSQLQRLLEDLALPPGWSVSLVDGGRMPLAGLPERPAFAGSARAGSAAAPASAPAGAALRRSVDLGKSRWSVVLDIAPQSRIAPLRDTALTLLAAVLAAIVVGWIGGVVASRGLARSVASLSDPDAPAGAPILEIEAARRRLEAAQLAREQPQAAVMAGGAMFRAVFNGLPDAAMLIDPDRRIRQVNRAFEQQFGWAAAEVIGRDPDFLYVEPSDYSLVGRRYYGPQVDADSAVYEMQYRRRDGSLFWSETTGLNALGDDGAMLGTFGLLRDITQRRQAQREMAQQQEQLEERVAERTAELERVLRALEDTDRFNRAVTDNLPGQVTYWDADLRCRFANQTFLSAMGLTLDEVLGFGFDEIEGDIDLRAMLPHAWAALRGERQAFEHVDARAGVASVHRQVIQLADRVGADRPRGIYMMSFDITALVQARRELHDLNEALSARADKLAAMQAELADRTLQAETATRAKSAFLANMSHEIRTPMNAILGLTHLMEREVADPFLRARLHKVGNAGKHLLQVVNDILDLSKVEANKVVLETEDFSVETLVADALNLVRVAADEKRLRLEHDLGHLPERLRGDPTRLMQMLVNLLSNAVKFTAAGEVRLWGEVLVDDGPRVLVRFEVQDTGPGIAAERLANLFQPFEQADASITRQHGGTGLGLALTRHLAALMGGETGVQSVPGLGSQFWFTAWLMHDDAVAQTSRSVLPEQVSDRLEDNELRLRDLHGGRRVLVAEDNPVNLEVAASLLESAGLTVDSAENGARAVELVASHRYDLVLMDMQMPVLDGLAATQAIRARPGGSMPIIAMTANAFLEDREACLAAGMNDHVAKPVDPAMLYATLLKWLPAAA